MVTKAEDDRKRAAEQQKKAEEQKRQKELEAMRREEEKRKRVQKEADARREKENKLKLERENKAKEKEQKAKEKAESASTAVYPTLKLIDSLCFAQRNAWPKKLPPAKKLLELNVRPRKQPSGKRSKSARKPNEKHSESKLLPLLQRQLLQLLEQQPPTDKLRQARSTLLVLKLFKTLVKLSPSTLEGQRLVQATKCL